MLHSHHEHHHADRVGGLRAAVLGANDGIIPVASLAAGVAPAGTSAEEPLVTGTAGLVGQQFGAAV